MAQLCDSSLFAFLSWWISYWILSCEFPIPSTGIWHYIECECCTDAWGGGLQVCRSVWTLTAHSVCYDFFFLNSFRNWFRFFLFSSRSESSLPSLGTLTEVFISFLILSSDWDLGMRVGLEFWEISRELGGRLQFPTLSLSLAECGRTTSSPPLVRVRGLCLAPLDSGSESSVRSTVLSISQDEGDSEELKQNFNGWLYQQRETTE